jgi:hypothetical protein
MEIPSSWLLTYCHCWPNVPDCVLCQFSSIPTLTYSS